MNINFKITDTSSQLGDLEKGYPGIVGSEEASKGLNFDEGRSTACKASGHSGGFIISNYIVM